VSTRETAKERCLRRAEFEAYSSAKSASSSSLFLHDLQGLQQKQQQQKQHVTPITNRDIKATKTMVDSTLRVAASWFEGMMPIC